MNAHTINEGTRVQAAPGQGCMSCGEGGRMVLIARAPLTLGDLIRIAHAHGEGPRAVLLERARDLIAAGQLIELDEV